MSETEAIETLGALVEYIQVVNEVVEAYLNGETDISSLKELSEGMKNILKSFEEVE